jgi:hypothetical protein
VIIDLKAGRRPAVDTFEVASPGDLPGDPFWFKFHVVAPLEGNGAVDRIK